MDYAVEEGSAEEGVEDTAEEQGSGMVQSFFWFLTKCIISISV